MEPFAKRRLNFLKGPFYEALAFLCGGCGECCCLSTFLRNFLEKTHIPEPEMSRNEISNNLVCATSKGSDQPMHTRSLIRAFASRLDIL